jgi:hypothetical protein
MWDQDGAYALCMHLDCTSQVCMRYRMCRLLEGPRQMIRAYPVELRERVHA